MDFFNSIFTFIKTILTFITSLFPSRDVNEYQLTIEAASQLVDTGDILLMSGTSNTSRFIECITVSEWSHVAIVGRDPSGQFFKGQPFVFESVKSDDGDKPMKDLKSGKHRVGVRVVDFQKYITKYQGNAIAIRSLISPKEIQQSLLKHMNEIIGKCITEHWGKGYENSDMEFVNAQYPLLPRRMGQETPETMFCSELVTTCYIEAGLLDANQLFANKMLPEDFDEASHLQFCIPEALNIPFMHFSDPTNIIQLSPEFFIAPAIVGKVLQ
jgi:hypothetical protein